VDSEALRSAWAAAALLRHAEARQCEPAICHGSSSDRHGKLIERDGQLQVAGSLAAGS
jgi:hypothetical protein